MFFPPSAVDKKRGDQLAAPFFSSGCDHQSDD